MKIAVVGTGYVGLVAGAGFADFGHHVHCVDVDAARIAALADGKIPIHEPGLDDLVRRGLQRGTLSFTADLGRAVAHDDIVFLAVGTPSAPDGSCDTSLLEAAAESVGRVLAPDAVVVIKSTVPVGTCERVRAIVARVTGGKDFSVVSNPEFLTEGNAVNDFMKPARIILGVRVSDDRARDLLRALYAPFVRTIDRILVMDPPSAEICKYACNAMLATRVSFMNELARLCEKVGADVEHVRQGMAWDERIGARYLFPGIGFGGSCLPKDVRALVAIARQHDERLQVVEAVQRVNEAHQQWFYARIAAHLGGTARHSTVAIWGLAFKPNTDDIREAPAVALCEALCSEGARVRVHDPVARSAFSRIFGDRVEFLDDPYEAATQADALVLVTEWHEYRRPDFSRVRSLMRSPVVFDGRNIWDAAELRALGFTYFGMGRS